MYATVPKAPGNQSMASSAVAIQTPRYIPRRLKCKDGSFSYRCLSFERHTVAGGLLLPRRECSGHSGRELKASHAYTPTSLFAPGVYSLPAHMSLLAHTLITHTTDCNTKESSQAPGPIAQKEGYRVRATALTLCEVVCLHTEMGEGPG
jgi:hypothetical protein